jgi:hypothetical protein
MSFYLFSSNIYTLDIFPIKTVHQRVDYACMPQEGDLPVNTVLKSV